MPTKEQGKPKGRGAIPLCLFISLLFFHAPLRALKTERIYPPGGPQAGVEVVSGEVILKFNSSLPAAGHSALLAAKGMSVRPALPETSGWSVVALPEGRGVAAALAELKATSGVDSAEPNRVYRVTRTPNDWYLKSQGYLDQVKAFGGWEYETGSSSRVTVAVMDTGIDSTHYELSGKLVAGSRFFDPNNGGAVTFEDFPVAACSHGTAVASLAAAATDNGFGMAGLGWNARLLSLRVFALGDCSPDCALSATCGTDTAAMLPAITYARLLNNSQATGRIILNMSLGEPVPSCDAVLGPALTLAANAGVIIVASAGNDGGAVNSPANCTNVIPVGAVDSSDVLASFSSHGADMMAKGVVAPGVNVFLARPGSGFSYGSGTSFAAPLVSGLAALMWAARPTYTAATLAADLRSSADLLPLGATVPNNNYGAGRINAYRAVYYAKNGTLEEPPAEPPVSYSQFRIKAAAFPNPFRPASGSRISLAVPPEALGSEAEAAIYSAEGEMVKKLDTGVLSWDGKNSAGAAAASGIYFFQVTTNMGAAVSKFALIR